MGSQNSVREMLWLIGFLIVGCPAQYANFNQLQSQLAERPACKGVDDRAMEIWEGVELKNDEDNLKEFFIPPTVSRLYASEIEQCSAACACTEECVAFTYHPNAQKQNNCWLKSDVNMDKVVVRKVKKMKEGQERSSSGIKCAFKMSQAIEDALARPADAMNPEGKDVADVCSSGVEALSMWQTSTKQPEVETEATYEEEETTKKENIQLMTTKGLEVFTTHAEIKPTEKPEKAETTKVVTEEDISKTTVVLDDIDVITEPLSEEEESSTDEEQKKPRERKLSKGEIAAIVVGSIVGAALIGGVIAVAVVQAKEIQAENAAGDDGSEAADQNNNEAENSNSKKVGNSEA